MNTNPPAEKKLRQLHARRIRIVTTSTVAALVLTLLLITAWFAANRMSATPSILDEDPRIKGTYLVPVDDAFELAAQIHLTGGAAGEAGRKLRDERQRFNHVLFGYAEIAYLNDHSWIIYIPTRLHTQLVQQPIKEFLDSTAILTDATTPSPNHALAEYHLLPDGIIIAKPGLSPLPQRHRITPGPRRDLLNAYKRQWRYFTNHGYFPPELQNVADAIINSPSITTSDTLVLWHGLTPATIGDQPSPARIHPGIHDILETPTGQPAMLVDDVLPLFQPESSPTVGEEHHGA